MPSALDSPVAPSRPPEDLPAPAKTPVRLAGLDRLRGLALLMMLVHHFTAWLTARPREVLPGFDGLAFTDLAAPAFAVTAGASMALFVGRADRKGMGTAELSGQVLRRYGALIPSGMLLTLVALSNLFYFSVLDALGWSALVAYLVVRFVSTPAVRAAVAITLFVASSEVAGIVEHAIDNDYVVNAFTGKFPVLEYAGFALVGALAAPYLARMSRSEVTLTAAVSVAIASLATLVVGAPDRYPGGLAFVIPGLAGTAVMYAAMVLWNPPGFLERAMVVAGVRSLGIYVSHYGLYMSLRATGLQETLHPIPALFIALVLTGAVVVAALVLPPLPISIRKGSTRRRGEVRSQEADRVGPDLVSVGGGVRVPRENDQTVIDLRGS